MTLVYVMGNAAEYKQQTSYLDRLSGQITAPKWKQFFSSTLGMMLGNCTIQRVIFTWNWKKERVDADLTAQVRRAYWLSSDFVWYDLIQSFEKQWPQTYSVDRQKTGENVLGKCPWQNDIIYHQQAGNSNPMF